MSDFGFPELVLVENEWYDGPRGGICLIENLPHRFVSNFDENEDNWQGTFRVAPITQVVLDLEIEQWKIFVDWNDLYEDNKTELKNHPATGGIHKRYDQIELMLREEREVALSAQHAEAQFEFIEQDRRYTYSGPGYKVSWKYI